MAKEGSSAHSKQRSKTASSGSDENDQAAYSTLMPMYYYRCSPLLNVAAYKHRHRMAAVSAREEGRLPATVGGYSNDVAKGVRPATCPIPAPVSRRQEAVSVNYSLLPKHCQLYLSLYIVFHCCHYPGPLSVSIAARDMVASAYRA